MENQLELPNISPDELLQRTKTKSFGNAIVYSPELIHGFGMFTDVDVDRYFVWATSAARSRIGDNDSCRLDPSFSGISTLGLSRRKGFDQTVRKMTVASFGFRERPRDGIEHFRTFEKVPLSDEVRGRSAVRPKDLFRLPYAEPLRLLC